MKPYITDIPVALIFFNRPECLQPVFDAVAAARPSKLYLIQDGPRASKPSDNENVQKCRTIVDNVDWDCQVVRLYSDKNLGCGMRIFSGLSEVFNREEYAVIIEDDIKIGKSFLPFCKEMCERYKDDQRIQMISGMNHLGIYEDSPYDYFFSRGGGAIWGWATWARCWKELDWNLTAASDPYVINCLRTQTWMANYGNIVADKACNLRTMILDGKAPTFWSLHFGFYGAISNRLNLLPKFNLIANIGLTGDSAHSSSSINDVPKRLRVVYYAHIYDMPDTLNHPEYVSDDQNYMREQELIMNPPKSVLYKEAIIRRLPVFIRNLFKLD